MDGFLKVAEGGEVMRVRGKDQACVGVIGHRGEGFAAWRRPHSDRGVFDYK
jgi:hypothetical protein